MTNLEKINKLNEIWYCDVISGSECGHKDRDCHFYINQTFSYGQDGIWKVEHYGYINSHYEETEWNSYEECQLELIRLLKYTILEEVNWYLEHYGYPDWDQHKYNKEQLEDIKKKVLEIAPD